MQLKIWTEIECIPSSCENDKQDVAVQKVVEFMDAYSLSQEDFDTIVELSKFQVFIPTSYNSLPFIKFSGVFRLYK